ncbi:MAG: SpoIIIAH-like family protein [Eubacterium sp.]|nr:SpoIIIAH-like family protein [Eubacterium sp.]
MRKNKSEFSRENKELEVISEAELKKRKSARKTKIAISFFTLLLAVGVLGNWYWENSDISAKVSSISAAKEKILGEATYVDATTEPYVENQYFSQARVERQSKRDEAIEKLQSIVDSQNADNESKKEASKKIEVISDAISKENKIETLVTAKGVNNCIAIINDDSTKVDIIVDCEELTDTVILQIKEIAVAQLKCDYSDITIIQSN